MDDDQLSDDQLSQANEKSYDRVIKAIKDHPRTITLSVGQLTTGVTVKPWTGVLMLSNMKSPAEYMQSAFRAQNPYKVRRGKDIYQKENAYVFDFDPARTLTIFDDFANNLNAKTAGGHGTAEEHAENIRKLLNFFPVIGGFMSNFLFANISRIFSAPAEVKDILDNLVKAKEEKNKKQDNSIDDIDDVPTDDEGNVDVPDEIVIGKTQGVFGDKVYQDSNDEMNQAINNSFDNTDQDETQKVIDQVKTSLIDTLQTHVWSKVKDNYGLTKKQTERFQEQVNKESEKKLDQIADQYHDQQKVAETEFKEQQKSAQSDDDLKQAQDEYESKMSDIFDDFKQKVTDHVKQTIQDTPKEAIRQVEQHKAEEEKHSVEDDARAHLRGFARTIPSFIMAYGDRNLKLQNFDDYTEDDVFKEVTGITEDQFRFLRDGGDYIDQETGKKKHFEGHLFDEVVFNDSIQQFLDLKYKLRNYFDENNKEDIFDYIPPQKTNQIFTPKKVVKHMVDDLEKENPNVFDDPNATFADLYMKSGLYITEIVKRLYANPVMKQFYITRIRLVPS